MTEELLQGLNADDSGDDQGAAEAGGGEAPTLLASFKLKLFKVSLVDDSGCKPEE